MKIRIFIIFYILKHEYETNYTLCIYVISLSYIRKYFINFYRNQLVINIIKKCYLDI